VPPIQEKGRPISCTLASRVKAADRERPKEMT
jgi:hypothetical protein